MTDTTIERVAMALAWAARIPAFLPRLDRQTEDTKRCWWLAISADSRQGYRYQAAIAIEAYETETLHAP